MASALKEWKNKTVCVVTSDGRMLVGTLIGNDQVQNLILNDATERVYSMDEPVEEVPLGLYIIRGDNICIVGELDASTPLSSDLKANALPAIQQQQQL